jgi:hypothetical protein
MTAFYAGYLPIYYCLSAFLKCAYMSSNQLPCDKPTKIWIKCSVINWCQQYYGLGAAPSVTRFFEKFQIKLRRKYLAML